MKTICFLIFTAAFSQTMTKLFLLTLDEEKESQHDSDILEQGKFSDEMEANEKDTIEKEIGERIEPKPSTTTTADKKVGDA